MYSKEENVLQDDVGDTDANKTSQRCMGCVEQSVKFCQVVVHLRESNELSEPRGFFKARRQRPFGVVVSAAGWNRIGYVSYLFIKQIQSRAIWWRDRGSE